MILRRAEPRDAPGIAEIWNPEIRETAITFDSAERTDADVAALIDARSAAGHAFFVAERADGGCLGFATYFQFRGGLGYARTMEHTIVLAPAARGKGLGRELMTAVEDHARAGGAHSIFGGVSSGNPAGLAFHARLGFVEAAILREVGWKFGRWFDLHLMRKML